MKMDLLEVISNSIIAKFFFVNLKKNFVSLFYIP